MWFGEMILQALSRTPGTGDYHQETVTQPLEDALTLLRQEYPDLSTYVSRKRVVDFGCGVGRQAVALALEEMSTVCGIDSSPTALGKAKALASSSGVTAKVDFVEKPTPAMAAHFDVAVSQNAMEHFPNPAATLRSIADLVRPGGLVLITFGPPWFAPYGAHMHFFCRVPYLNLLFSERTVMRVRSRYRTDGASRYEDVEGGLNRMSVAKYRRLVAELGLLTDHLRLKCVRRIDWLARIPGLRELFVNRVTCVLRVPGEQI